MIRLQTMPKETAIELLQFLAESESFRESQKIIPEGITVVEIKALLRELARELQEEVEISRPRTTSSRIPHTSCETQKLLSRLPSKEGEELLTAFGVNDEE